MCHAYRIDVGIVFVGSAVDEVEVAQDQLIGA